MRDMSKNHRLKRRSQSEAESAVIQASDEPPVFLDVERIEKSIRSPRFVMPSGLTPEEKRQFMIAVAHGHR
jgi:hypothetical protein